MGVKKIDTIQSAQIATLEADIVELKNKLNLLVADIQNITSNANQVIADLNDINDVIMAGYTAPSSPSSDGILQQFMCFYMLIVVFKRFLVFVSVPYAFLDVFP